MPHRNPIIIHNTWYLGNPVIDFASGHVASLPCYGFLRGCITGSWLGISAVLSLSIGADLGVYTSTGKGGVNQIRIGY